MYRMLMLYKDLLARLKIAGGVTKSFKKKLQIQLLGYQYFD